MASPRASWKGYLKIAEVTCPVGLYAAASAAERIALHTVNRATGNRVSRQFVDASTGAPVEKEDQVKGYEVGKDEYVVLEPEEILAAVPQNDKTLTVSAFIPMAEVDDVYFDRPYYLAPSDRSAGEAFALIREGLRTGDVAAIAEAVLFRRVRAVLIRAHGAGLAATTLNYDYEVRAAADAFADVPKLRIKGEMLELAEHIINTKQRRVRSVRVSTTGTRRRWRNWSRPRSRAGRSRRRSRKAPERAADLMAALRESAGLGPKGPSGPEPKAAAPRREAGAKPAQRKKRADDGARAVPRQAQLLRDARSRSPKSRRKSQPRQTVSSCRSTTPRRLHYDFRLELDGVLKSWAVTRGPSLVAGEKRLAVDVEDHPLEYGAFEGTIPKGEYGGGAVLVWDRGTWAPIGDPHKGLTKGHLEFELSGDKLRGRWHLVRMRGKPRDKHENWLLIKGDDQFARAEGAPDILEERPDSATTGREIDEVAKEAPGWSSKTAGKIETNAAARRLARLIATDRHRGSEKAPMPGFVEPMLATLVEGAALGRTLAARDQIRRLSDRGAHREGGASRLLTRSGLDWTEKFGDAIVKAFGALPVSQALIDGEMVVENAPAPRISPRCRRT